MGRIDKLLTKLLAEPKTFKWKELIALLEGLGYTEVQGAGCRVKYYHRDSGALVSLHKPHPGNEVKAYVVKEVADHLRNQGYE